MGTRTRDWPKNFMTPNYSQGTLSSRFEVVYTLVRLLYVRHREDPDSLLTIDRMSRTLRGRRALDAGMYERQFPGGLLEEENLQALAEDFFNCIPETLPPAAS
jgi:hypothetical protein